MELCDCNLQQKLDETKSGFQVNEVRRILNQLNISFRVMYDNKIMHRDIKLANILVKYENRNMNDYVVK